MKSVFYNVHTVYTFQEPAETENNLVTDAILAKKICKNHPNFRKKKKKVTQNSHLHLDDAVQGWSVKNPAASDYLEK